MERTSSPWRHVVTMRLAQLTHALSQEEAIKSL